MPERGEIGATKQPYFDTVNYGDQRRGQAPSIKYHWFAPRPCTDTKSSTNSVSIYRPSAIAQRSNILWAAEAVCKIH